jgi:hypothetical protein
MDDWEVIPVVGGNIEFWREEGKEYVSWNPKQWGDA